MPAKLRTTRKSSKGLRDAPRDAPAAAATETKLPVRDDRVPGPAIPDPQVRLQMIACAAYCRVEKRGFAGGAESQFQDWIEAGAEIDRKRAGSSIEP